MSRCAASETSHTAVLLYFETRERGRVSGGRVSGAHRGWGRGGGGGERGKGGGL